MHVGGWVLCADIVEGMINLNVSLHLLLTVSQLKREIMFLKCIELG